MALQGYRRSLILTPIKSAHETSLLFYATFSMPTPIPRQNFGAFPLEYIRDVGVCRERTMKLFSKNFNLCDHDISTSRTEWQTDGQTDDLSASQQYRTLRSIGAVKIIVIVSLWREEGKPYPYN